MYYHSFLGHLWDIFMSHKLRDIFGTLLGLIKRISKAKKPQEFNKIIHRKVRKERKAAQHEPLLSCVTNIRYGINNELERTDTNSGHSELVRVRFSSLLISVLRLLCATAHERAPMQPALHLRTSRAGG